MYPIDALAQYMRDHLHIQYSKFDYALFRSYLLRMPVPLDFTCQELPPRQSPLHTLSHIPTFPDNQWACAYWLCEPCRLHA